MINKLKQRLQSLDIHTIEVLKKSGPATIVKALGMFAGLLVSVSLGRLLGADGLGIINLANRIISIFLVICMLGMERVIIKEIAIARGKGDLGHINDVIFSSYWLNGGISFLVCVLMILVSPWLAHHFFHDKKLTFPLIVFFIVVTPQIFSRIYSSALVGYQKIWQSNLVNQALSTAITGLLLLAFYLWGKTITVNLTVIFYAIGRLCVTTSVGIYWQKLKPKVKQKSQLIYRKLLRTGFPLLLVSAALIISASVDSIMLGWLGNSREVGIYNVALRLASLTIFFLQITVAAISPKIATLYDDGRIGELKKMIQQVTLILAAIGFLSVIVFLILGHFLLSLWGIEFEEAFWPLIILSVGQFFNIASGPVGNILALTNNEKVLRNINLIILVINIVINFALIQPLGVIGASIATLVTMIINMVLSSYYVKKKIGFLPINFKIFRINTMP